MAATPCFYKYILQQVFGSAFVMHPFQNKAEDSSREPVIEFGKLSFIISLQPADELLFISPSGSLIVGSGCHIWFNASQICNGELFSSKTGLFKNCSTCLF